MEKWNKMEEIAPKLEDNGRFVQTWFPGEVRERKIKALGEYIEQLETRIGITDTARLPRYVERLKNEVKMAKKELKKVTESD